MNPQENSDQEMNFVFGDTRRATVNPFTGQSSDQPFTTTTPQIQAMQDAKRQANEEAAKMTEPITNPAKIAAEKAAAEEEAKKQAAAEAMRRINEAESKTVIPDNPVIVMPDNYQPPLK